MRRISIYSWFGFNIPMEERFRLIRSVGFDSTFIWWGNEFVDVDGPKEKHPEMARRQGLYIENVHLPFENANNLWLDNLESAEMMKTYMRSLEECAAIDIPTAVLHVTSGKNPPPVSEIGLDRMKQLVEFAENKSVNIALENLRRPEYLEPVFSNIRSGRLGFCYDSGHENCYTQGTDFLTLYGSKLMALHLHDNDGAEDQHRIPGEGNINWSLMGHKLGTAEYTGAIALEVTNEISLLKDKESPEEFLKRAYESAVQIQEGICRK